MIKLKAPFPYFGGKSRVAPLIWEALGDVRHYIEPFFGSGAVLLLRPDYKPQKHTETINDKDGFISNVWRSIKFSPKETAEVCDWPINHADLNARRKYLLKNESLLLENLVLDPEWHDPILAGYWIWAAACWIGRGLTRKDANISLDHKKGVNTASQRPHLTSKMGINTSPIPSLQCKHGVNVENNIYNWFNELSVRLRQVQVICGDYTRVIGGNWQASRGACGIFFDPPYGELAGRDKNLYHKECLQVAGNVANWAFERGKDPAYRIVLAGYYNEHDWLLEHDWTFKKWVAPGGYSNKGKNKNKNRHKETLFFSPYCIKQKNLFD